MRIVLANADFHCRVLGNGKIVVIAFHGFGQDGSCFQSIIDNNKNLTIYAIDLPFHGGTTVSDKSNFVLTPGQIHELVDKILQVTGVATFSIVAFSIGARLTFPIIKKYGRQVERVALLAPDGITENAWYRLATSTWLSRFLFRKVLDNQGLLKRTGTLLSNIGLLDNRSLIFALKSIDTAEKRHKVVETWTALRFLRFQTSQSSQLQNEIGVSINVFLGEKDAIITKSAIEPLLNSVKNARLVVLPCGHANMIDCFARQQLGAFYK